MPEFVGVFTADRDLVVQVWDSTIAKFTGIEPAAASGRPLPSLIPDLESRGFLPYFRRVLEQGVVEVLAPAFHQYLIPCLTQTPSTRFDRMRQRVTIAPLEEAGHIAGVLVTIEDVTERLAREREVLAQLPDGDPGVVLQALEHPNWRVRESAVEHLARLAAPAGIAALLHSVRDNHRSFGLLNSALEILRLTDVDVHSTLVDFLGGEDEDLRIQAALALGNQNDARAVPALIIALKDPSPNVVYHSIEALGKMHAHAATEALTTIAESRDFFLAFPALDALGEIGDPLIVDRLLPLLQDPILREPAAQALGRIADESVVEPLVQVLNGRDAPTEVIATSLVTLYDRFERLHREGRYIAELCGRSIRAPGVQNLIDALAGETAVDLRPLVMVLGWSRSPSAASFLARRLGSPGVQDEVVDALVSYGFSVVDSLMEQLHSEDIEVRSSAVAAIGRIRDKRATSALTALLARDEELRIPILAALTSIGDPTALDSLFALLATPDAAVRRGVVSALNSLASPEMLDRVTGLLDDENPGVREAAVRIAGYFGYRQSVDPVLLRCNDEDENVRRAAIEHLPYLDDPRVAGVLAQALKQEVPSVRAAAAAALSHEDSSRSISCLMAALDDSDPWVRYFTARSLDRLRAREAGSSLQRVAESDPFHQVRIAALEALSTIDTERAASVAKVLRSSQDPDLRRAAGVVLEGRNGQL